MDGGDKWRCSSVRAEGKSGRAGTAVSKLILDLTFAVRASEAVELESPVRSEDPDLQDVTRIEKLPAKVSDSDDFCREPRSMTVSQKPSIFNSGASAYPLVLRTRVRVVTA